MTMKIGILCSTIMVHFRRFFLSFFWKLAQFLFIYSVYFLSRFEFKLEMTNLFSSQIHWTINRKWCASFIGTSIGIGKNDMFYSNDATVKIFAKNYSVSNELMIFPCWKMSNAISKDLHSCYLPEILKFVTLHTMSLKIFLSQSFEGWAISLFDSSVP